jgi:hypothetical protein
VPRPYIRRSWNHFPPKKNADCSQVILLIQPEVRFLAQYHPSRSPTVLRTGPCTGTDTLTASKLGFGSGSAILPGSGDQRGGTNYRLASQSPRAHASGVFVVSNRGSTAVRTAADQGGELRPLLSYADCSQASPIAIRRGLLPGPIAGWKTRQ